MKTPPLKANAALWQVALAFLSGVLLALAFPKPGIAALAWIGPGLLLWLAGMKGRRNAFRAGFSGGLGFYLTSLHWLLFIPMPLKAISGWLALSCFLALFMGAWCWICWRTLSGRTREQSPAQPAAPLQALSLLQTLGWFLFCAAAWVTMEMVIARIFTGFPWMLLGVSQFEFLPLIQIAAFAGVSGISFIVAWASVTLVFSGILLWQKQWQLKSALAAISAPFAVLLLVLAFGLVKTKETTPAEKFLTIALIQPSFPQPLIWDPNEKTNRFNALLELSRAALETKPDLLVWPETSLPDFFTRHNAVAIREITQLAMAHNVWIVFGANDTRIRETNGVREVDLFNSAFLVNPAGELANRYHKRQLVIFGEYMPLRDWFPFLKRFRASGGGLAAGVRAVPFELGAQRAKTAVLICFEDVFPHLTRESISPDTDFLLNLTNDGWFGQGSAQWQHAAIAIFRAVENGLPLVRCTNNGLTCWVDSQGRLHEVYFAGSHDVHAAGFKLARVPLNGGAGRPPTFYNRYGDLFGWGCVLATALAFFPFGLRRQAVPTSMGGRSRPCSTFYPSKLSSE